MSSVEQQLQEASSRNTELLAVLSQTDYAPPALKQQEAYIKQLDAAILRNKAESKKLSLQREKEHKDHRKYSESVARRFLYKASGQRDKFATKAEKEEREYFDALKAEHQAQDERDKLAGQMEEAQQGKTELQPDVTRHEQAQKDLDALYHAIFAGDTPAYPEEDEQEYATQNILGEYQRLESTLKTEEQVSQLLAQAQRSMTLAQNNVQDALGYSRVDMFGGGALWDMMERSALGRAEMATGETYRLMSQARNLSSNVQPLPGVNIASGSLLSDVFFDNIFTDYAFHAKIQESAALLQRAADALRRNIQSVNQRRTEIGSQMSQTQSRLAEERRKLQKVREEIFAKNAQPPPAYSDAAFS